MSAGAATGTDDEEGTMDEDLHRRIEQLVAEEHDLRARHGGLGVDEAERARLGELEVALDRTWDLLRQRSARRTAGQDPDGAAPHPEGVVEGYTG